MKILSKISNETWAEIANFLQWPMYLFWLSAVVISVFLAEFPLWCALSALAVTAIVVAIKLHTASKINDEE